MRKKILYCASTSSHILNFHIPYLRLFHELGWQVDVAAGTDAYIPFADNVFVLPLKKRLLALGNIKSIYEIYRILRKSNYDLVCANTTLAGAVVRCALLMLKRKATKVIYISHGYFFNKGVLSGAPFLCVEKALAPVTDMLLVMNEIDYQLSIRHKLCKNIKLIPGMGVDTLRFSSNQDKSSLRAKAGFKVNDFLIVYAAEMSKRKNQSELIRAFSLVANRKLSTKLLLAGDGDLKDEYTNLVDRLGLKDKVYFLGHVNNVPELYCMCDLAVSTSRSEGLPFNIVEAMYCGLPVIASRVKGHIDLLGSKEDCLYEIGDELGLANRILSFCENREKIKEISMENKVNSEKYDLRKVKPIIVEAFKQFV
jgi:glycosyltransferase EpsD